MTISCYRCNASLNTDSDFGRQDTCPKCNFATKCCKNCVFYDTSKYNECAESAADRVVEKEKSNFCDYFKPGKSGSGPDDAKKKALAAAEALFKK